MNIQNAPESENVPDDAQLVEAARAGDVSAFSTLVSRYYPRVYGLAYSKIGQWDTSEELCQETFLVAYANLSQLKKPGSFQMWLFRILRNLSKHWLRSEIYRRKLAENFGEQHEGSASDHANPATHLAAKEQSNQVCAALRALRPGLREALVLYYMQGKSTRETADILGISENAVSNRLHHGRKKLRGILERQLEAELSKPLPPESKKRIMAGLSFGPALPHIGQIAAKTGIGFGFEQFLHGTKTIATTGVVVMTTKKTIVLVTVLLLFLIAGVYSGDLRHPETPPLSENSDTPRQATAPALPLTEERPQQRVPEKAIAPPSNDVGAETTKRELDEGEISDPALYCSISGTVWNKEGPIRGASVLVTAFGYDKDELERDNPHQTHMTALDNGHHFLATTDHRGYYRISGIRFAESATVFAHKEGYVGTYARPDGQQPRVVFQPGDALEGIDIRLSSGVTLKGRVLTPDDLPVPDAIVHIMGVGTTHSKRTSGPTSCGGEGLTFTDEQGGFSLDFYELADYCNLQVISKAHGQSTFRMVDIRGENILLRMEPPARMNGAISGLNGRFVTDKRLALRGISYLPTKHGKSGRFGTEYVAELDRRGHYEITGIDPGQSYSVTIIDTKGREVTPQLHMVDFIAGETRVWDYTLYEPSIIRGRVLSEQSGLPIKDVEVRCDKDGEPLSASTTIVWNDQLSEVRVQKDGRYEFRILTGPGNYMLFPKFMETLKSHVDLREAYGKELQLAGGEEIELDLVMPESCTLSVQVVDQEGNPVPDVLVEMRQSNGRYGDSRRTDDAGRISFSGFPPHEPCNMAFGQNPGYVGTQIGPFIGEPGQEFPEEILMVYRSTELVGLVVDQNGEPFSDTRLIMSVTWDGITMKASMTTDERGLFHQSGLPATEVDLEITVLLEDDTSRAYSSQATLYADEVADLGRIILK
jgi:RNA polymerase sigma-70 factor, ECF subfamily